MRIEILGWTPFILLFIATGLYYVLVSVRNNFSSRDAAVQAVTYFADVIILGFIPIVLNQQTHLKYFYENAWLAIQNVLIQLLQTVSIGIGGVIGAWL